MDKFALQGLEHARATFGSEQVRFASFAEHLTKQSDANAFGPMFEPIADL
jgi:hypothetical protein